MKRIGGVLLALALVSCARGESSGRDEGQLDPAATKPPGAVTAGGTWSELPKSPLEPRHATHAVSAGGRLLLFGGTPAPACPPGADCITPTEAPYSDAAA